MQILLDECVPRPLKRELTDYEVRTVVEMGWAGKKNGELLKLMMQDGFTILLTADQNLRYQQNLQQAGVAVIVMVAPSNRLADLLPLIPSVCSAGCISILQGRSIPAGNLLVISKDLLPECFAPTNIFAKMRCTRSALIRIAPGEAIEV